MLSSQWLEKLQRSISCPLRHFLLQIDFYCNFLNRHWIKSVYSNCKSHYSLYDLSSTLHYLQSMNHNYHLKVTNYRHTRSFSWYSGCSQILQMCVLLTSLYLLVDNWCTIQNHAIHLHHHPCTPFHHQTEHQTYMYVDQRHNITQVWHTNKRASYAACPNYTQQICLWA